MAAAHESTSPGLLQRLLNRLDFIEFNLVQRNSRDVDDVRAQVDHMRSRKRKKRQGRLSADQLISSDRASALQPVTKVCGILLRKTQLQIVLAC